MRRGPRQRQRHRHHLDRHRTGQQFRRAHGQCAGLVEHHGIDLGQPLQRCAVLDQHTLAKQLARRRRHHRRHRQSQRTRAGDDQHRRRDIDGKAQIPARPPHPEPKGRKAQNMHQRRVQSRRPLGQCRVARLGAFRDRHQFSHAVQRRIAPRSQHAQHQRPGQIDLSRRHHHARPGKHRQAFPGQQPPVQFGCPGLYHPIHRHPPAGPHQHQIAPRHLGQRAQNLAPVHQHHRARHLQRCQLLRRRPRQRSAAMVQIAAQQQEKRQHHCRVEIGLFARMRRLIQADAGGQDQRQRDRHIHPQPPDPQRRPGRAKERLPDENYRRDGNQRRNPVKHVPRGRFGPRPDRHRQQHDVHHREKCHAQPHQQFAALPVGLGHAQQAGVQLMRLKPHALQHRHQIRRRHPGIGLNRHAFLRQIDPRRLHARLRQQRRLDGRDTGRAMRRRQRQHQPCRRQGLVHRRVPRNAGWTNHHMGHLNIPHPSDPHTG